MAGDPYEAFQRYLAEESKRGLGDIPLRPTAALAPISRAQMEAATNLLDKALRALDTDDEARARRFVERAVALPWDEHEQMHPAAMMAHQQMYDIVTDALEQGGDEWLAAATDTLHAAGEEARYCLRDTLVAVLNAYELTPAEERRARLLIKDVPPRAELPDLDLPPEELTTAILDVLDGVVMFLDAWDEILELTDDED